MALEYHRAASALFPIRVEVQSPAYYLYCHMIELALKAYLRAKAGSAPYVHELSTLLQGCEAAGLQPTTDLKNVVSLLEAEMRQHGFRYFAFISVARPSLEYLRTVADDLMAALATQASLFTSAPQGAVLKMTVDQPRKK